MGPALLLTLALGIDPQLARSYLAEAGASCKAGALLWPRGLCGPIVIVDAKTRGYVTADGEGTLPKDASIANTAANMNGSKWIMLQWPLPEDRNVRLALMLHESFHFVQADIGFPMANPANPHLDSLEGRYWIELEWRALAAALESDGDARRRAAADAVGFRRKRRAIFPDAAATERALEMNEGLAEYTGVSLSGDSARLALRDLADAAAKPTFVRSFAYATGPAYGLLLDAADPAWRKSLKPTDDLADLLVRSMKLGVPAEPAIQPYDGAVLRDREVERDQARRRRLAEFRKLLIEGPVLEIPLRSMSFDFNPDEPVPIEGFGTVYPTITVRDDWGRIEVAKGALLAENYSKLMVSATARGTGWKLDLKPGWKIVPGKRAGDLTIARDR